VTKETDEHRYMGIDVGTKRYGVALSDVGGSIASPHETLEVADLEEAVSRVVDLVASQSVAVLVVGWPVRMDGTEGRAVEHVRRFVEHLQDALEDPSPEIVRWDERLTSSAAEDVLLEADLSRQRRRDVIDKVAASRILQNYLDAEAD
jgi:putative Holliday junction resolvase